MENLEIKGIKVKKNKKGVLKTKETITVSYDKKKKFNLPILTKGFIKLLSENVSFDIKVDTSKKILKGTVKNHVLKIKNKKRILSPDNIFDVFYAIVNNKKKI